MGYLLSAEMCKLEMEAVKILALKCIYPGWQLCIFALEINLTLWP
jgi:hypothetical protein